MREDSTTTDSRCYGIQNIVVSGNVLYIEIQDDCETLDVRRSEDDEKVGEFFLSTAVELYHEEWREILKALEETYQSGLEIGKNIHSTET